MAAVLIEDAEVIEHPIVRSDSSGIASASRPTGRIALDALPASHPTGGTAGRSDDQGAVDPLAGVLETLADVTATARDVRRPGRVRARGPS
jgi:hypothetical protein